jgi:hypothetical protein
MPTLPIYAVVYQIIKSSTDLQIKRETITERA